MFGSESRYDQVSRRAMLKGSLGLGALVVLPGIACGNSNDATVLANVTAQQAGPSAVPTTPPVTEVPAAGTTVSPAESPTVAPAPTDPPTPTATVLPSSALPVGAELVVDFSYVQSAGGKNLPPYVAIWLEDSNGELVETIELWYQQDSKGPRWLPDLKRWFTVDSARQAAGGPDLVDVVSGATRLAGSYTIAWDGQLDLGPAPTGDYFICVESARERGPYSLIREPISLNGAPFERALTASGELQAANVAVRG